MGRQLTRLLLGGAYASLEADDESDGQQEDGDPDDGGDVARVDRAVADAPATGRQRADRLSREWEG